ncbi:MAG TPA: hypothetical protein VGJ86_17715 [Acidimicrobiales bacterium]|jgi:hypothetical protein
MSIDSAAWLGFGGVVAGAAMGYASSAWQESARRKHDREHFKAQAQREDGIRFEARRFDAYVAMITAANRFYGLAKYPAVAKAATTGGELSPFLAAYEAFMTSLSPAFLMATSNQTRECIATLAASVRTLFEGVTTAPDDGAVRLEPLFKAHRKAVKGAEAAMREEFGLVAR